MTRRRLGPVPSFSPLLRPEFDPSALTSDEQDLALLCQALHDLPWANEGVAVGKVQRAFHDGDVHLAIRVLAAFLEANGLDPAARTYAIDPKAFRYQRGRKRLTQENLAASLGVKTPQISHVEKGRNSLSLPRILLVLTAFDVNAEEIFVRNRRRQEPAPRDKVRPLRGMNEPQNSER